MKYFVYEKGHKCSDAGRVRLSVRNCYLQYAQDVISILKAAPCRYSECETSREVSLGSYSQNILL